MTTLTKKIPLFAGMFFFALAALASVLKGGGLDTAFLRGLVAGGVSFVFTALLSYIIFAEKLPEPTVPPGLEELNEKFKPKKPK